VTRPKPRTDRRCWSGCGRYGAQLDLGWLTDERRRLLEAIPAPLLKVMPPRACWAHREQVEAETERQIESFRRRRSAAA